MADPNQNTSDSTPSETKPAASENNDKLAAALSQMAETLKDMRDRGDSAGAARVAEAAGLTPDQVVKMIDSAAAEGRTGEGVIEAMRAVMGPMANANVEREGRREVENLENSRKYSKAFEEHGAAFKKFLREERIPFAGLAEPGRAAETFDYFLKTKTDWVEKKKQEEIDAAVRAERKKVEDEFSTRISRPASPALPVGARPEGGVLNRLVRGAGGGGLSPEQIEIARNMGAKEDDIKRIEKAYEGRTAMGMPLDDFITTRNEGAVD